MNENLIKILLLGLALSCSSNDHALDLRPKEDYAYLRVDYDREREDTVQYRYFNQDSLLVETIDRETRTKYIYAHTGRLAEVHLCRTYYCERPISKIFIYDSLGNHLGYKYPMEEGESKLEITKHYDGKSRLVKELLGRGQLLSSDLPYEDWKHYVYKDEQIIREVRLRNEDDTLWTLHYFYVDGKVAQILHQNRWKFKLEAFAYDEFDRVVTHSKQSSEFPLAGNVSHHPNNLSIRYFYDQNGLVVREVRVTHDQKVYFDHQYFYRTGYQSTEKS